MSIKGFFAIMWLSFLAEPLCAETVESSSSEEQPQEPSSPESAADAPAPATTEETQAEPSPQPATEEAPVPPLQKMSFTVGATYFSPFTNRSDPLANIGFSLAIPYGDSGTVTVSQAFTKYFYLQGDQGEYDSQDTVISFAHRFTGYAFKTSAQFDATLPTSKYSQAQHIRSKPRISAQIGDSLWDDSISWRLGGFYRYFFNEFKSTRFETNAGGDPLPWMHYGGSLNLSKALSPAWDLSLSVSYSEIQYERDTGLGDVVAEDRMADHPYSLDISASHELMKNLSVALGYSSGSQVEAFGGTEFVIFDDELAIWYVASTFAL